jgi:hypothetical protein
MKAPADSSPKLSELAQAAGSVAIGVYLVGLLLAMAGNSVSGSSALVHTIKAKLFAPWMQPAWLDLGFDHPLTYGAPEDADHTLEVRSRAAKPTVLSFPGERSGEQAARWRRLARVIAVASVDGNVPPLIAGVGEGSFADAAADDLTVRILRRPLPERTAPSADARNRQPYAARVRRIAGEIQVIELGGAAKQQELAPVLRSPKPGSPAPPEENGDG